MALVHKQEPTDCSGFAVMVQLYVDDELAAEERGAVESHLGACPTCQNQRDELLVLKSHLFEPVPKPAPASLVARVKEDVASAQKAERRIKGATIGALVLLIVAVGGALFAFFGQSQSAAETSRSQIAKHAWSLHALDVPVDIATPDRQVAERYVRSRIAGNINVPALDVAGFGLNGARIVDLHHQRGAQLLYTGRLGERLTIIAVPDADGALERQVALATTPAALTFAPPIAPALFAVHHNAFYIATGDVSAAELVAVGRAVVAPRH